MSSQPLLPGSQPVIQTQETRRRRLLTTLVVPLLLLVGIIWVSVKGDSQPDDPLERAKYFLKTSPVIDGHIDVPEFARMGYENNVSAIDLESRLPMHFDIPRAREGHLGGLFWSIFVACRDLPDNDDYVTPGYEVRDTLEQIDVSRNIIARYSDTFEQCRTTDEVMAAVKGGKIASLFGVEGAHSIGSSLGALRTFYELGVRYMTLTHSCNNAVADSGGIFNSVAEKWGGLSSFGREVVKEMNRLGMVIDLSHVSDKTASQALALTRAPVMWSHSCARHFNNISRNVPDHVLDMVGRDKHKTDGVVMVNFYPAFAAPKEKQSTVDVVTIANHVDYIAQRIGKHHVGIGSDYDGIEATPIGLEDVSKYPNLFAELIRRGWSEHDLTLLAGGNFLRILRGVEDTARKLQGEGKQPSYAIFQNRKDMKQHKGFP